MAPIITKKYDFDGKQCQNPDCGYLMQSYQKDCPKCKYKNESNKILRKVLNEQS